MTYGEQRELANHDRICQHLGRHLLKLNKYNVMDWTECIPQDNLPWYVEQKARKITIKTAQYYNTLMIGKNKIDFFKENAKNCRGRIYFDLLDGLYYIDYDEKKFDKYWVDENFQRQDRDCDDKLGSVVHIPFSHLSPVSV